MKRINRSSTDKRLFACPQCDKPRMSRPLDHVVSMKTQEYKISDTESIELLIDICDFCRGNNQKKYFDPKPNNVKQIMKAIKEQAALPNQSIEELL